MLRAGESPPPVPAAASRVKTAGASADEPARGSGRQIETVRGERVVELLFWGSAILILYPYLGYPLVLMLLARLAPRPIRRGAQEPTCTLIITAYNEIANIRAKLDNALALDYPADRLQIIVASDCSDDGTDQVVREYAERGIELVATGSRGGKVAAQNAALERATGEILVFSDARIQLSPESLRAMMADFGDPEVGCVSSTDRVVQGAADATDAGPAGEGVYVRYEMWLRELESVSGTLIGASGSFYAVRRSLAGVWDAKLTRDFLTPLKVVEAGYRAVPEPQAIGTYHALDEPEAEFRRKVRTVMRGMAVLFHMRVLLNPLRHPGVALRLWSHKVLRWTVPFFLVVLLGASIALSGHDRFYAVAAAAQLAFYALAVAGFVNRRLEARALFRLPLFFAAVNLSILMAWMRFAQGSRQVTWESTRR